MTVLDAPILSYTPAARAWRAGRADAGAVVEIARDRGRLYALRYPSPPRTSCLDSLLPLDVVELAALRFGAPSRARARELTLEQRSRRRSGGPPVIADPARR
jgi:hypothetical protein